MPDPADERQRRTRATYDAVAADFLARTRDRSRQSRQLDRFAACVGRSGRVLDVGAGPCTDSAELRARGLRVVSLDLSLAMLRAARQEIPGPRVQATMLALPFARIADGAWVNASLLHLPREDVPRALAGLHRVLRPGGWLWLAVKRGDGEEWETARYGEAHPRWFTYWRPDALDARLETAGFRIVEREPREGSDADWIGRLCRT